MCSGWLDGQRVARDIGHGLVNVLCGDERSVSPGSRALFNMEGQVEAIRTTDWIKTDFVFQPIGAGSVGHWFRASWEGRL